jgi:DNA-binding transcriptional LysR family regulator
MYPAIHQLEYFVTVAEEAQFTRAAERLHVAQPSVSAQVRRLEAALGVSLFHRGAGPVTLTDAGEALLPLARRVLKDMGEVVNGMTEVDSLQRGHVGIGATPSLSATLLPSVLGRFHRDYPGVTLTVVEQGSLPLMKGLESGELDVALAVLPVLRPGFERITLAVEELVVVISRDHPLARRRRISITDLAGVPMVMFRDGYDLRTTTLDAFRQVGLVPQIAVEGGELGSVIALAAEGLGPAIIPSIFAIADTRLHVLRLQKPRLCREIALVRRGDRQLSRAATALSSEITTSLKETGWPGASPDGLKVCV